MWTVQKGERGRSFEQKRTVQSDSGWSFVKRLLSQSGRSWTVVSHFPTSARAFQLQLELFNFAWLFSTSAKLSNFRLSNLKLSNFSFFPTALSNYTYPLDLYCISKIKKSKIFIAGTRSWKVLSWNV